MPRVSHRSVVSATCATLVLLCIQAGSAWAIQFQEAGSSAGEQGSETTYSFPVSDERPGTEASVGDGGADEGPHSFYGFPVLSTDPVTGEECTAERYAIAETAGQAGAASADARAHADAYYATIGTEPPPPCSTVTVDVGQVARQAVDEIVGQLTPAQPYVQPNNTAITGIRSHLTTGLDSDQTRTTTVTLFGRDWSVSLEITGVHTIDWGDGTIDTGVTGDGGAWHDGPPAPGDIVHHYLDVGAYDLVVTTDWAVTATLVGTGATATQTLTTTSPPITVDVDEVRSARDR